MKQSSLYARQSRCWLHLKRKDSRLRDWNFPCKPQSSRNYWGTLKRKDSRLRDWNRKRAWWPTLNAYLEKKRFSITRLKRVVVASGGGSSTSAWKEKILDYEIETMSMSGFVRIGLKILKRKDSRLRDWNSTITQVLRTTCTLEKKRFSITRLKLLFTVPSFCQHKLLKRKDSRLRDWNCTWSCRTRYQRFYLKRKDSRLRDWNRSVHAFAEATCMGAWKEKILDYEIETVPIPTTIRVCLNLEKKRFSITRLKLSGTLCINTVFQRGHEAWKEKILDYEIETQRCRHHLRLPFRLLKRKDSRLRDWNKIMMETEGRCMPADELEKKRFSITRLKTR